MNQEEHARLFAVVDVFSDAMKQKLVDKALQGYWGWDDAHFGFRIRESLQRHVERGAGQEVDVANLAMFLWWHQQPPDGEVEQLVADVVEHSTLSYELAQAHATIDMLNRELQEERRRFPADGVWLVTSDRSSSARISPIGDLPEPMEFARIAMHRGAIAAALHNCWQIYHDRALQAPLDVADAIIEVLHKRLVDEEKEG